MAESQVMLSLPSPSWRGIRVGGEPPKVRSGHTSIPLGDRSAWASSPLCASPVVPPGARMHCFGSRTLDSRAVLAACNSLGVRRGWGERVLRRRGGIGHRYATLTRLMDPLSTHASGAIHPTTA